MDLADACIQTVLNRIEVIRFFLVHALPGNQTHVRSYTNLFSTYFQDFRQRKYILIK